MIRLSNSQVGKYLTCPHAYRFEKVERLAPKERPVNLVFGREVDRAITEGLRALTLTGALPSAADAPVEKFARAWEAVHSDAVAIKEGPVHYTNKAYDKATMDGIGRKLVAQFFELWRDAQLSVALLPNGAPALQVELEASLGDGVGYKSILDILVYDREGALGVIDVKTASQAAFEEFPLLAPQLTDYQFMVAANAAKLGIGESELGWLRFIELVKSKSKPVASLSVSAPMRTQQDITERIADIKAVARDIRARHFPKRPGLAFNSPCRMCEFRQVCLTGDTTGFVRMPVADVLTGEAA